MKRLLYCSLLAAALVACKKESKLEFGGKIAIEGKGDEVSKAGDFLSIRTAFRTDKDSLLGGTFQQGAPAALRLPTGKVDDPFVRCFFGLRVGDSANFLIPADTIFKLNPGAQRPPFLKPGMSLKFGVAVVSVEDSAAKLGKVGKDLAAEVAKSGYTRGDSGVYYKISQPGQGQNAMAGDTLYMRYRGHVLGETKDFDGNMMPGTPPFKFVLGMRMVIAGWDEGLKYFNQGASGQLLIPYKLGYGEMGAGPQIKPYSTLVFDVVLEKISKPKGVAIK